MHNPGDAANALSNNHSEQIARRNASPSTGDGQAKDRLWWFRPGWLAACVAVLCYINTPSNDYCEDGNAVVRHGAKVNAPDQWLAIWTTDYWSDAKEGYPHRDLLYRPVSLSSFRLVRELFGTKAFPQLACNVLLHALICALVARFCGHVGGSRTAALLAGFIMAVLPIHTEVLNNVIGRADLITTLAILAAILWHRRSMNAVTAKSVLLWRIWAALAALVAMGSKESGISVVPLVVLFDGYWYRRWRPASHNRRWWDLRSLFRFSYLLIPTGAYLLLRLHALEGRLVQHPALTKTVNVLVDAPAWQHALGVIQLWGMYWQKTIWPYILCVNYSINEIRLATSLWDFNVLLGLAVTAALAVASILAWRRGVRSVAFLSAAIVLAYAPTANALALIQVFFAERIWFLPSVWIALLAGLAASRIVVRPAWYFAAALVLLAMTQRCWRRNAEWHNELTLYAAAYRDLPEAVGVLRLYGQALVEYGQVDQGIRYLRRAVLVDQGFTDVQRVLGQAYRLQGDLASALDHLQIANMQVPGHPQTEAALAEVSAELTTKNETKLKRLKEEAAAHPDDMQANLDLVELFRQLGHVQEALQRQEAGLARFGKNLTWRAELAVTLVFLNKRDQAIDQYWKCVQMDPSNARIAVELAMLLLERREGEDLDHAQQLAERAAAVAGDAPYVLACQAELLALRGELGRAAALYQKAIEAFPIGSEEQRIYQQRAKALGQ